MRVLPTPLIVPVLVRLATVSEPPRVTVPALLRVAALLMLSAALVARLAPEATVTAVVPETVPAAPTVKAPLFTLIVPVVVLAALSARVPVLTRLPLLILPAKVPPAAVTVPVEEMFATPPRSPTLRSVTARVPVLVPARLASVSAPVKVPEAVSFKTSAVALFRPPVLVRIPAFETVTLVLARLPVAPSAKVPPVTLTAPVEELAPVTLSTLAVLVRVPVARLPLKVPPEVTRPVALMIAPLLIVVTVSVAALTLPRPLSEPIVSSPPKPRVPALARVTFAVSETRFAPAVFRVAPVATPTVPAEEAPAKVVVPVTTESDPVPDVPLMATRPLVVMAPSPRFALI